MNVQMVRARSGWCPISSPGADLILLSRGMIQYHALHSLPRPNIQGAEDGGRGRVDGEESAKVERESAAAAQLRTPSGLPPAKAAPTSARGPALPLPLVRIVFLR